jgi:hypothetical protein
VDSPYKEVGFFPWALPVWTLEAFKAIKGPPMTCFFGQFFWGPLKKNYHKKNSKIFTKGLLKKSQKAF